MHADACHGITARTASNQPHKQAQWHDQHVYMLYLVVAMQAERGCQSSFRVSGAKLLSVTMIHSALPALSYSLHCVTAVLNQTLILSAAFTLQPFHANF